MGVSPKRAIVSVINDLTTDQRVDKVCNTLVKIGFDVLLVGRKLKTSLPLKERRYKTMRLHLFFVKGALFYATYNIKLFWFLLVHKAELLVSNDLDTLPANYFASKIRHVPLVHDCHEYFRGMPELNGRKSVTGIWKKIEDHIFPRLTAIYAVNASIARIYGEEYQKNIGVIRNVPYRKEKSGSGKKRELNIPEDHQVILYQGAVNMDRGLEEAIQAMKFLKTLAILVIIGTGDRYFFLKQFTKELGLNHKVIFTGQIPFQELHAYTMIGDIGISIEKDVSLNYHYCLPNKFLDYIQALVPVLISPLPEMQAIVERYSIGAMIENHDPVYLAGKLDEMLTNKEKLLLYRQNLVKAADDLCWENEEKKLIRIFEPYA